MSLYSMDRFCFVPSAASGCALWVVLTLIFEFTLGYFFGYSPERILSDYNIAEGGLMLFGVLFMLFAPALAAKLRGVDGYCVY